MVGYEMGWTTQYFLHRAEKWRAQLGNNNLQAGPKAYAARQAAQWNALALDADQAFRIVNQEYTSVM